MVARRRRGAATWISGDGTRVLRGVLPDTADELQVGCGPVAGRHPRQSPHSHVPKT
jgi:hypothetical protein